MKLTLNNQTLELKKIGQGKFSRVYLDVNNKEVYAMVKTDKKEVDYSKEAVSLWTDKTNPHIPNIEVVENEVYVNNLGYCNIYKMPYYQRCPNGNKIVNRLISLFNKVADSRDYYKLLLHDDHYEAGLMLLDSIKNDDIIPDSIKEAIENIFDASTNYGQYLMEFAKRNIMQDNNGNIILLDIIFNPKALKN